MSERTTKHLTMQALFRAVASQRPEPDPSHGPRAQYCAHAYQDLVGQFRMQASTSRRGNCFDNAPIGSFWGTLKSELVYHRRFATRDEAKRAISEYIEMFYNRQRRRLVSITCHLWHSRSDTI